MMRPESSLPSPGEIGLFVIPHEEPWTDSDFISPVEEERARRFRFEKEAHRFRLVRSRVRQKLADYLGESPQKLVIRETAQGKPEVDGLAFSVSHSAPWSILGVTETGPFGIDLEKIEEATATTEMARRILTESEFAAWDLFEREQQVEAFFELWTCKEAYLKALGVGLQIEPNLVATDFPEITKASAEGYPELIVAKQESPLPGYALAFCGKV